MRLHCINHGYMDEKTGPMAECPYCRIEELEEENNRLREALEKLARLGNGERYGNSDGNMIARAA